MKASAWTFILGLGLGMALLMGCAEPTAAPTATAVSVTQSVETPADLAQFNPVYQASTLRGIEYVPEGGRLQSLDIYLPDSGEGPPYPTILAIHGGGFQSRDKTLYGSYAQHFQELGYAFVSMNYRLVPAAIYPAQVADVFCALAWIHANDQAYGFDTDHILVMGDSAGAYLAGMLGTVDETGPFLQECPHVLPSEASIRGVVALYGFFDVTSMDGHPRGGKDLERLWGAAHEDIAPETLAEMSPQSWVDSSDPPFLLIHGTADTALPSWLSERFAQALQAVGVPVELLLLEAEEHGFILQLPSSPSNVRALSAIEAFDQGLGKD